MISLIYIVFRTIRLHLQHDCYMLKILFSCHFKRSSTLLGCNVDRSHVAVRDRHPGLN